MPTQRPRETDLVTQLEHAGEVLGAVTGHGVHRLAGMKPLAGQPVSIQREDPVEEGVPLLDGQGAALTVDETELIVQPGVCDTAAGEQRSSHAGAEHRENPTDDPHECSSLPGCDDEQNL
jgi:hypothetical protein